MQAKPPLQQLSKCRSWTQYISLSIQPLYVFFIFTVNYPSFPFVAEEKDVGTEITGLIFASWSIVTFVILFILPSLQECFGRRKLFLFSLVVISLSMIASGFLPMLQRTLFIFISFALRILQGSLTAIMNPMYFQFGALLYPDSKDTIFSWQFIAAVAGIGLGPAVGAPIQKYLGFDIAQYFVAIIGLVIFFPLAVLGIPKCVDKEQSKECQVDEPLLPLNSEEEENDRLVINSNQPLRKENKKYVAIHQQSTMWQTPVDQSTFVNDLQRQNLPTFGSLLLKPRIIAGMTSGFSSIFTQVYFTPYLSKYLLLRFGIQKQYHGLYYGIRAISSALNSLASPWLSRKLGRSNSIWLFFLILIFSHVFFAQSWVFGFSENIIYIMIGLFLMGLSQSQMFIPIVPEMTQYLVEEYIEKGKQIRGNLEAKVQVPQQFIDKSVQLTSSLFVFSIALSEVVGPMMGAALYEHVGYRKAGDLQNLVLIILCLYYSIYGAVRWLSCRKKNLN